MRKGENIFKRKDGRWEARYIKGYELSGKIRYGFCYGKTYKEAKEKAAKCKAAVLSGTPVPQAGDRRRFAFFCDEWLQIRKNRIRESTYIKYATILDKYLKPMLGGCCPSGITASTVEALSAELLDRGLAVKTVQDILVVLRGVLKYTSEQLSIPAVQFAYPKESRREMRVLSREEQQRLVRYLLDGIDACKFGVLLMLLTGMRIGELCALRWESIDLQEQTIRVSATLSRLRDTAARSGSRTRIVIGAPKSDTSARTFPMSGCAASLCRRFAVQDANAYILTGTQNYMEPRTLQYRIEKYTRDCGLEGVHAHTLRHTFATRAVEVGFEIKSLSEVLGHANTTITLERYVHSSMELKRSNMDKLTAVGL